MMHLVTTFPSTRVLGKTSMACTCGYVELCHDTQLQAAVSGIRHRRNTGQAPDVDYVPRHGYREWGKR